VVNLSEGHSNGVWLDYALDTTSSSIRDHWSYNAIVWWFIARPVTAMYAAKFTKGTDANLPDDYMLVQSRMHLTLDGILM